MVEKVRSQTLNAKRGGNLLAPVKTSASIQKKSTSSSSSSSSTSLLNVPKDSTCDARSSPLNAKVYKGVRMRTWGKWVSEIREPNKRSRIWLGSFSTAEMAAKAYDAAVVCLRGPSATLNFPESPPSDLPLCSTPRDVQAAAAAAAAAWAPPAKSESLSTTPKTLNSEDETHSQHASSCDDNSIQGNLESPISATPNPTSMATDMEKWINAEFGYLESLDEACDFPELLMQLGLANCSPLDCTTPQSFFDKHIPIVNSPSSDNEDSTLYDPKLWCFN